MEKNHHRQALDFFYVFFENPSRNEEPFLSLQYSREQPKKVRQDEASSSSAIVSTELSLSPSTSSSSSASSQTKKTLQCFGNSRKKSTSKPNPSSKTGRSSTKRSFWGYSTTLKLYDDPWKIKKVLTASDLGKLNRLLLGSDLMENLMLPAVLGEFFPEVNENMGIPVWVRDVDTMSMHQLVLKKWASFKNYVLIGDWSQDFVKRRGLKKGDEIGLHWDSYKHCFNFSLLKAAMPAD